MIVNLFKNISVQEFDDSFWIIDSVYDGGIEGSLSRDSGPYEWALCLCTPKGFKFAGYFRNVNSALTVVSALAPTVTRMVAPPF